MFLQLYQTETRENQQEQSRRKVKLNLWRRERRISDNVVHYYQ